MGAGSVSRDAASRDVKCSRPRRDRVVHVARPRRDRDIPVPRPRRDRDIEKNVSRPSRDRDVQDRDNIPAKTSRVARSTGFALRRLCPTERTCWPVIRLVNRRRRLKRFGNVLYDGSDIVRRGFPMLSVRKPSIYPSKPCPWHQNNKCPFRMNSIFLTFASPNHMAFGATIYESPVLVNKVHF